MCHESKKMFLVVFAIQTCIAKNKNKGEKNMNRWKLRLVALIFIFVLASVFIDAKFVFAELEPDENGIIKVTEENIYTRTKYFDNNNPFGIIGGFHLVGFNSVKTKVHTNGNILTNKLIYEANFGTKGLEEISYIKNLEMESGALTYGYNSDGSKNSILVVGKNIEIGKCDNGNAWTLNGYKVNYPPVKKDGNFANQLWQDSDEYKFVDIDLETERAVTINQRLKDYVDRNTESHLDDINNQYIEINNPAGVNIYNLDPNSDLIKYTYRIDGRGFEHGSNASLVINVDLKDYVNWNGEKIFSIPNSIIQYSDGPAPIEEVTEWQDGNIIWNFYDSSQTDGCYTGKITNSGAVTGIILAPKATVELNQNLNGSVIANDIIVNAESHRTDFTGANLYPDSDGGEGMTSIKIKVEKKWEGQKLSSASINLLANDEIKETVELNENNDWTYEFKDLPLKDGNNNEIMYYIDEVDVPGYLTQIEKKSDNYFIITNTEQIDISVKKEWYGNKLDSAVVHLYANATEIDQVELNQENNWKHDFKNLNKYKDNQEIVYSIIEDVVPNYTSKIIRESNKFIIKNISAEKTNILVRKEFVGNKLPEVTINLLADGEKLQSIKLNAENNWQYEFRNLNKYDEIDGHKILYDIDENEITGYTFSKTGNSEQGFVITNTKDDTPEEPDKPNKSENPPSFNFTTIENDPEDGIVIWHNDTEKNNDIYSVPDFDIPETVTNDETKKTIDVVAPDDIENPIYQSVEIENNTKELPKTGDGMNMNFYIILTAISGSALFLIGLMLHFKKKYD